MASVTTDSKKQDGGHFYRTACGQKWEFQRVYLSKCTKQLRH